MKRTFKTIMATAALAMAICMPITAYADNDYTRDEIIDEYWTQYWKDSLPGEENPEGSLEYHILENFLDEQYGHYRYEDRDKYMVSDWSSYYDIREAWQKYNEDYTKNWHMTDDDETGEFYIESYDPETDTYGNDKLYTFTLADGKWNMVDSNGDIVDSFDPHGGDGSWAKIKEEANDDEDFNFNAEGYVNGEHQVANADGSNSIIDDQGSAASGEPATANTKDGNARVTGGKVATASAATSEASSTEKTEIDEDMQQESSSSMFPYIILIIAILAVVAEFIYLHKKKKEGKK